MKHLPTLTTVVSAFLFLFGCGDARAQYAPIGRPPGPPYARPPVLSPYLDLVRGANTPAINLYLGTQPEIQRRRDAYDLRRLEQDFSASQTQLNRLEEEEQPRLYPTGHATYFMNLSPYYYPAVGQAPLGRPNTPMQPRSGTSTGTFSRPPGTPTR
jgi:hypothetical protein